MLIIYRFVLQKICNCTSKFGIKWDPFSCKVCFPLRISVRISFPRFISFLVPSFNWWDLRFIPLLLVWLLWSLLLHGTFAKSSFMSLWLYVDIPKLPSFWLALLSLLYKCLYSSIWGLRTSLHPAFLQKAWGGAWRDTLSCYLAAFFYCGCKHKSIIQSLLDLSHSSH